MKPRPRLADPTAQAKNRALLVALETTELLFDAALGDPLAAALLDEPSCGCDLLRWCGDVKETTPSGASGGV